MTPMPLVRLREQTARRLMRAGRNHMKLRAQRLAHLDQRAAVRVGSGLDPDHRVGAADDFPQRPPARLIQLVQDMADHQRPDAAFARARRDLESGKERARRRRSELHRVPGMIAHAQAREMIGTLAGEHAPARDAAAAAPIEQCSARRRPATALQLIEHRVPLPADALGVGEVVVREILQRSPIHCRCLLGGEKGFAQAIQHRPVERVPSERIHEG